MSVYLPLSFANALDNNFKINSVFIEMSPNNPFVTATGVALLSLILIDDSSVCLAAPWNYTVKLKELIWPQKWGQNE